MPARVKGETIKTDCERITPGTSVLVTPGVFSCVEQRHCEEFELVRQARAGDRAAFDRLAEQYRPALRAMAFLRTSDREAAQDLAQETLTRAWAALPTRREPGVFVPWLKRIAGNACLSWHPTGASGDAVTRHGRRTFPSRRRGLAAAGGSAEAGAAAAAPAGIGLTA